MVSRVILISASLLGQDAGLEHARQVNLERAANLPNYVADEVAERYTRRSESSKWKYQDTIETEITVRGIQISRQNWRRNGKPVSPGSDGMNMPTTGFGAALKPLFDRGCPTTLGFAGREEVRGQPAAVYRFRSPANGCFGNLYGAGRTMPLGPAGFSSTILPGKFCSSKKKLPDSPRDSCSFKETRS